MRIHRLWAVLLAVAATGLPIACNSPEGQITLQGAGATFPAPLYQRWFLEYYKRNPGTRVNYQPIGSGAGVRQFSAQLVDFGASDSAMSDKEIEAVAGNVLMVPMTAGSVVLCFNLKGAPKDLRLSRATYPRIFLGEIQNWNDSAIAADNPGVLLPDKKITVVRRSDGSGTTYAFTNHLAAISRQWKDGPGVGKSVQWAEGIIGGRGNAGVAALVQQTEGAIGYLEYSYAKLMLEEDGPDGSLGIASLENKSGKFIQASPESGMAGLEGVDLPANLRVFITDPKSPIAYPIVTYTWLLCYARYENPRTADELKKVIHFCLTDGQNISAELGYIPLPDRVRERILKSVEQIQ